MSHNLVPRRIPPLVIGSVAAVGVAVTLFVTLAHRSERPQSAPNPIRVLQAVSVAELSTYAGNEACASCHRKEFQVHAPSEHARAMSRVTVDSHGKRFAKGNRLNDAVQGFSYQTAVKDGRCVMQASGGGVTTTAEATFGFGSGKHAITYLGRQEHLEPELRLSYYHEAKRWDFSPGQPASGGQDGGMRIETGVVRPAETVEGCFVCHSTVIAKEQNRLLPETVMMGVGCEACHGAGKAHIEAVRRGDKELRMAKLSALNGQQISQQLCGQCHRSPAGDDPHDEYNRSQLARFQGLAMSQSLCFTNSSGKLSCLTCHDAHDQKPKPQSFYNAKCSGCHSGAAPESPACSIDPKGDCVSCHMPAQSVGMPVDLRYRTHWIKVWAGR
jgi:hypothetical protein